MGQTFGSKRAANRQRCLGVLTLATLTLAGCIATEPAQPTWTSIFDGQNLDGWTPKVAGEPFGVDPEKIFRAGDGILLATYEGYSEFETEFAHLFYNQALSDYRLRLEYRFTGSQLMGGPDWAHLNSGVMLHAQDPAAMPDEQLFPVSVEGQFLGTFEGNETRPTANICTPGTHVVIEGELDTEHCISSDTVGLPTGEWVQFEADVKGHEYIKLYINGDLAFELTEPQLDPTDDETAMLISNGLKLSSGYIALQAESHPIEFRNIQLLNREIAP